MNPPTRRVAVTAAILVAIAFSLLPGPAPAQPAGGAAATEKTLVVMTYNLRYASATPPNAWPQRRPLMRELIQSVAPDVMGTQEGVYEQLKDLAADLPEFDWIGLGRDGGSRGEFMAVYYRKARLDPLAFDHFWLSDTPELMASTTWGPTHKRMVTWVKFRDRATGSFRAIIFRSWHGCGSVRRTEATATVDLARSASFDNVVNRAGLIYGDDEISRVASIP